MTKSYPHSNAREVSFSACPASIRIGTRGSALALAQAHEVQHRLLGAFPELTQNQIEIIPIMTTGDRVQDRHLAEIGGKGLFTKEIEEALFAGSIDIAVHSMKDMPDTFPDGLIIECILEREDPRDAFISHKAGTIMQLPCGAVVGTSSTRRQSQLLALRPDLRVVQFRGNVNTRLRKLEEGQVDGTLLAAAGLKRLDMGGSITSLIEPDIMLPAVAQGAIGVQCLEKSEHIRQILTRINHPRSHRRVMAERAFLKGLGGNCTTPMGALADYTGEDTLHLEVMLAKEDGSRIYRATRSGNASDAQAMGIDAAQEILSNTSDS